MGGVPRNPAPRNHFLAWIVRPSGCHPLHRLALDTQSFHSGLTNIVECRPPLRSASPFSDRRPQELLQGVVGDGLVHDASGAVALP